MLQVTKQDDGWYCEYDSKVYPTMVRRYVMLAKCTDATAELNISIFNEQVRPTHRHRTQGTRSAFSTQSAAALQTHCRTPDCAEVTTAAKLLQRLSPQGVAHRMCS